MLRKILFLLTPKEKRRGLLVLAMFILMALLETAGIASLMPFLAVLSDPTLITTNEILETAYSGLGFRSVDAFLTALGFAAFTVIIVSALFRALTHYVMNQYIEMRRHSIGRRLLETYLRQPYVFFLGRHSSDLSKAILSEVDHLIQAVFRPGAQMLAYSVVAIAIVSLMVSLYPGLTTGVAVAFGVLYLAVFFSVRGVLARFGENRWRSNKRRFIASNDAISAVKNIKLRGQEQVYISRFSAPSRDYANAMAVSQTLSQVPKFFIEAVGFGSVVGIVLVLIYTHGGASGDALQELLPILGVFVYAAARLLPAIQRIYQGAAHLRFGGAAVDELYQELRQRQDLAELDECARQPLVPQNLISIENLEFTYPNATSPALRDIELTIPVGQSLGIVGGTGAGKTTLVDVILGLLQPTKGTIVIDGETLAGDKLREWQRAVGYVPQDIFLVDATIAENIALGTPYDRIDQEQLVRCAKIAQIHEFVITELSDRYSTLLGEGGVRLSGGQRQRLGIARALYHNPAVIVLDEATSALDVVTETAVMDEVLKLAPHKTIVLITHRLNTARRCDNLLVLEKGQIVESGTTSDLEHRGHRFTDLRNIAAV